MAIKKSELYSSLWKSCDELRGGMDASQYKDYGLSLLFIKYISDKYAGQKYAPINIPVGASFADMIAMKGAVDIGDQINKKVIAPLAAANQSLNQSDFPDFNDPVKLGDGKERTERLTNLISIFQNKSLDFSKNRADGDDILGDAYEYLMRNFAVESGKSKGQFLTPAEVSMVMAQIIGIHRADTDASTTVNDPTCGSGSLLLKVVDQAIDFVMSKIAAHVGTRSQSAQAPVTYEIPRDVVAEAIVNAVAHRDYTSNASVQVMLFADRLEITNPGELPRSLTLESLRLPHNSVPRNPLVAEGLYLTQYIERMGTGTGDMIRLCQAAGLREPEFSIRGGFVTTIWRDSKVDQAETPEASGKMSGKIVQLMRDYPEITIPELAAQLSRTERTIERLVKRLREDEIIARIGPAKGGHWEVLE